MSQPATEPEPERGADLYDHRVFLCDKYVDCDPEPWAGAYCKLQAGHDGPCSAHYPASTDSGQS